MLKKKLGVAVAEIDWYNVEGSLGNYFKVPSTLIIPVNCVKVGRQTFWGCDEIKKVIIPESVDWIGYAAFAYCKGATIILKKSESEFKEILPLAFKDCKYVKEEIRA